MNENDYLIDLDDETIDENEVLTFDSLEGNGKKIVTLFLNGMIFLLIGVGALVWLFSKPHEKGDMIMPGLIGGFSVIPIFLLAAAFFLMRTARRVVLSIDGIEVIGFGWSRLIRYDSVAKLDHRKGDDVNPMLPSSRLLLLDENGKTLARLPVKMTEYEVMEAELLRRINAARGQEIYDRAVELEEKRRKKRRQLRWVAVAFAFFTVLELGAGVAGYLQYDAEKRMKTDGVVVEAAIEKHYLFNNRGPRIEYSYTVGDEIFTRDAILFRDEWNALEGEKTVRIRYLPGKPATSRVENGEDTMGDGMLLMVVGFLGGPVFAVFFVLTFLGYDLETHEGKFYLIKPGQILEDRLAEESRSAT